MVKYEIKEKDNNLYMSANMEELRKHMKDIEQRLNEEVELYILKFISTKALKTLVTKCQNELYIRNLIDKGEQTK